MCRDLNICIGLTGVQLPSLHRMSRGTEHLCRHREGSKLWLCPVVSVNWSIKKEHNGLGLDAIGGNKRIKGLCPA